MDESLHLGTFMTQQQNEIIEQAVKNERKKLLKFIKTRVGNEEDASDILQDVFYQLASNHGMVETIENMASWLYRVTRNKIIDWYRKRKTESIDTMTAFDDEDEDGYFSNLAALSSSQSDNPDAVFERQLVWDTMYEALSELPEEQREVFILHELENKSFNEIAEQTGVSVNTLLSRKRYAVLYLREKLKDLYDELINK
ncbi:MAG: RNA polymerase sigma factor [Chitinophagales bacterium]|jgi:RNA polymerase sigma factor (sigma-70 family)|nr:RNA polymerase sigma factor [Bacteroidota bacterium]MBK9507158.1 RNA polymerase sigma factor [Bacteroidota bacterium]MBK9554794.1 RNA polymerase sigma factor [Bacteroidota bacterium]MBL0281228.1 RNA polymerase sigma factor [Bacteroidota bacterium]MBP8248909.1 RNA polymerase sigma factor [Chitinophagales bacterium]